MVFVEKNDWLIRNEGLGRHSDNMCAIARSHNTFALAFLTHSIILALGDVTTPKSIRPIWAISQYIWEI